MQFKKVLNEESSHSGYISPQLGVKEEGLDGPKLMQDHIIFYLCVNDVVIFSNDII